MIRVLHVVTHMNRGGLETMIMNYYRNIDREKVQFDFLVHRKYEADYDKEIELLGGKIYRLSVLNPFSLSYRQELNSFFKEHKEYQIVHVHQDCLSSIILKSAKKNNVKVRIAHSHNINQDKNLKYLIKLFYRQSIPKYATDLMACGEEAGKWMFKGAEFKILNNAINTSEYIYDKIKREKVKQQLGLKKEEIVIGHVGRFSPQKNHIFLIKIFKAVIQKKNAKLLLVGDGNLRGIIENEIENLGSKENVIFTGVRSDIADLMQAMDVFVFPSLYEGLPVTMVEAQAAGLPCVISDNVPSECIITEGLVIKCSLNDSENVWVNYILKSINKQRRDTRKEIINAGFDIRKSAKELQEFYLAKEKE